MPNSSQVDLIFAYRVVAGREALFEQYLKTVLPLTEAEEPYVLEYHLFRREDGIILQHERYADEQAIRDHLRVTAAGQKLWGDATELLDIRVVGPVSDAFLTEFTIPASAHFARFRSISRPQHHVPGTVAG
ncbi:antibiotic biosynthesis monooxygenase [Actinosynnema sp. CS-041913]|uniref:antibiotic biosynthesis monooxygenase n=1 Tax=Actinosynnema sp. CS-041913 TaxID=3239917 RepID=UPI003D8EFEFD